MHANEQLRANKQSLNEDTVRMIGRAMWTQVLSVTLARKWIATVNARQRNQLHADV